MTELLVMAMLDTAIYDFLHRQEGGDHRVEPGDGEHAASDFL